MAYNKDNPMTIEQQQQILRELREKSDMSRRMFAYYTGIPIDTLKNWETGKAKAPDYVITMLRATVLQDMTEKHESGNLLEHLNDKSESILIEKE